MAAATVVSKTVQAAAATKTVGTLPAAAGNLAFMGVVDNQDAGWTDGTLAAGWTEDIDWNAVAQQNPGPFGVGGPHGVIGHASPTGNIVAELTCSGHAPEAWGGIGVSLPLPAGLVLQTAAFGVGSASFPRRVTPGSLLIYFGVLRGPSPVKTLNVNSGVGRVLIFNELATVFPAGNNGMFAGWIVAAGDEQTVFAGNNNINVLYEISERVGTRGVTGPSLLIEYFDNDPATFGPTLLQGVILDAIKIGWSWYSRYPSNAFFTLRANSVHNLRLLPLQTHIRITYYNPRTGYSAVVFTGRLSEPDHSGEDVVWTAWNYLSELSLSRSGYRTLYPGKLLGTEIAAVEWAAARTATYALLNFVTTGTIENPLGTDEVTPIVTDNRFGVIDVPRLLLMFDLTEIGRANTVHNVTMGITRTSPFSFFFLKNAGTFKSAKRLTFPGNVRDFRYVPGYAAIRNDLATIGTAADGSAVEIVKTDEVNAALYGRRQDVFTIKTLQGQVGAPTESDAQNAITARAVKESTTLGQSVLLDVRPELVEPFDGWDIEDTITVEVYRGRVAINGTFRIIGCRGLQDESGYHPQIYIQLPTQA